MRQIIAGSATAGVVISLCAYYAGMILKKKTGLALFNPLLLSVVFVIAFLSLFQIDYDSYLNSAEYLSYLLTPATVSLAIPLYKQLETLKKNVAAIAAGIGAGVLTSLSSVLLMSRAFRLSHEEYVTLLPKSITTAIGMGVSEELGGCVTITVAMIIVTGILGNMTAEFLCRICRLRSVVSRGLAIGAASHAIGTAKAMEMGEEEGAMSSLAIVMSGLCTVIGATVFAGFY